MSKRQRLGFESSPGWGNMGCFSLNVSDVTNVSKFPKLLGIVCLLELLGLLGDIDA